MMDGCTGVCTLAVLSQRWFAWCYAQAQAKCLIVIVGNPSSAGPAHRQEADFRQSTGEMADAPYFWAADQPTVTGGDAI